MRDQLVVNKETGQFGPQVHGGHTDRPLHEPMEANKELHKLS